MSDSGVKDEFLNLSTKFLFVNFNNSDRNSKIHNVDELNHLLNELNSLDYKSGVNIVDLQSAVRLLQSLPNIPADEETLVVKSCCLIKSVVKHQKLKLQENILNILIEWLLKALNLNFESIVCDIFDTLKVLIRGNSDKIAKFYDVLFSPEGILIKSLFDSNIICRNKKSYETNSKEDVKLSALLCVEAFLLFSDENIEINIPSDYILYIGNNVLGLIYQAKLEKYGESNYSSLITSALSICRIICWKNKMWANEKVGEILGAAKPFILYKIPNSDSIVPQKIMSSQQSVLESRSSGNNTGGKVAKTRKPKHFIKPKKEENKTAKTGKNETMESGNEDSLKIQDISSFSPFYRTSDSDFSETEANRVQFDRKNQSKVRESALIMIGNLAKAVEKRVFFGYWHALFPLAEPPIADTITVSLLNSVLKDPSPNCRIAALRTISVIFYGSKSYLSQVDMSDKGPSNFTPFSVALGNMVTMIYTNIIEALSNEGSLPVLMQILKCLTILIQTTPINRLKFDLIKNIVFFIRRLIYHKDSSIQVAALMVMGIIISTPEITLDILEIVGIQKTASFKIINTSIQPIHTVQTSQLAKTEYDDDEIISDDEIDEGDLAEEGGDMKQTEISNSPRMSWLLHRVLENLGTVISPYKNKDKIITAPAPVRIESLQVLSAMSVYYVLLKDHLSFISTALNNCLSCDNNEIRLSSGKCLESIGHGISAYLLNQETVNQDDLGAALNFWLDVLPLVIEQIQNLEQISTLKSVCCDALSNIGVHVFEKLPRDKHINLISLLAATAYSDDSIVKAASVRALAVYSLFPSLKEDLCFIENTAESIILLMNESNLQVRIKASWSLGNITDALISSSNYMNNNSNLADTHLERINDDLLRRLIEISSHSSDQVDRVKSNIMRSMGNLLKLLLTEHLKENLWINLFLDGINKIIVNGLNRGNVKVKWNACYAIGNVLKNNAIYEMSSIQKWQSLIYPSLCNIILNCNNFKVRTNGVIALTIPTERKHYGTFYKQVWNTFLLALEQSDDLIDFNEYKHRDNLMDQLCLSLSHLLDMMTRDDILPIVEDLIPKIDTIKHYWIRVINRLLPEKVAPLLATTYKLENYNLTSNLNSEQKSGIKTLCSCFIPVTEYI